MAKNIQKICLHRHIERSVIVQIIFEAVTQIFSCHSFETDSYFLIISINFNVQLNSASAPKTMINHLAGFRKNSPLCWHCNWHLSPERTP